MTPDEAAPEPNPYQAQERNVQWSVGAGGKLTITVNLHGESLLSKSGNYRIVARTPGFVDVDDRLFSGTTLKLVVGHRLFGAQRGWLEKKHSAALREHGRRERRRLAADRKAQAKLGPKPPRKPRSDKGKRRGPNARTKSKEALHDQVDEGTGGRNGPPAEDCPRTGQGDLGG